MSGSGDSDKGYNTERSEETGKEFPHKLKKSSFIVSPADIEVYRKAALKWPEVSPENLEAYDQLCDRYNAVFFTDSFWYRKNSFA